MEIHDGKSLRLSLKAKNLTIEKAAEMLGVSRSGLHNYLNKSEYDEGFKLKVKERLDIDIAATQQKYRQNYLLDALTSGEPVKPFPYFTFTNHLLLNDLAKGPEELKNIEKKYNFTHFSLPPLDTADFAINPTGLLGDQDFDPTDILICRYVKNKDSDWSYISPGKLYIVFAYDRAGIGKISIEKETQIITISNVNDEETSYWANLSDIKSVCIVQAVIKRYSM